MPKKGRPTTWDTFRTNRDRLDESLRQCEALIVDPAFTPDQRLTAMQEKTRLLKLRIALFNKREKSVGRKSKKERGASPSSLPTIPAAVPDWMKSEPTVTETPIEETPGNILSIKKTVA